ncbi:hypothetical protein [Paenibacillus arenosi]|uniref:Uncharacterized protein n=1 Tax=Paenibacillus arenosi TaxID=2774142 RepID=A0ABR9AYJ5_9BACL|nr:hypothetical protein [Paenibacillus arenosi]MBD8497991.1 hypothetical protein [Paenibacillus arenosi]
MATIITGSTAKPRTPTYQPKGTSSVYKSGGFLFFTDCPEPVGSGDLVDAGKWMNRDTVSGSGFVYSWHHNKAGKTIKHGLLVYNPNSYAIKVSSSNHGTTNLSGSQTDTNAWKNYFSGTVTQSPVVINPNSFGVLFQQSIPNENVFGYLGKVNVSNNGTSAAASAIFYDLAWVNNYIGASEWAPVQGRTFVRGKGAAYYSTIHLAPLAPTDANPHGVAYKFASSEKYSSSEHTIFGTDDLVYITDPGPTFPVVVKKQDGSGNTETIIRDGSGFNSGAYGQQMAVTMKIKNTYNVSKNFKIYMGKTGGGGFSFPLINMGGVSQSYAWVPKDSFVDIIDTGTIPANSEATITFFLVIPAMSSTPFVIGARTASFA